MNQGDRLAFSNGILGLSVFAAVLLIVFARRHARADPALHDRRVRLVHAVAGRHGRALATTSRARVADQRRDQRHGALVTGIVLVVVAVTKAHEGAWIIMLLIPVQVVSVPDHQSALQRRGGAVDVDGLSTGTAAREPGHRSHQWSSTSGRRRARLRADAFARCARRLCRCRP